MHSPFGRSEQRSAIRDLVAAMRFVVDSDLVLGFRRHQAKQSAIGHQKADANRHLDDQRVQLLAAAPTQDMISRFSLNHLSEVTSHDNPRRTCGAEILDNCGCSRGSRLSVGVCI